MIQSVLGCVTYRLFLTASIVFPPFTSLGHVRLPICFFFYVRKKIVSKPCMSIEHEDADLKSTDANQVCIGTRQKKNHGSGR